MVVLRGGVRFYRCAGVAYFAFFYFEGGAALVPRLLQKRLLFLS